MGFRDSNSKRVTWESENLRYCAKKMLISPSSRMLFSAALLCTFFLPAVLPAALPAPALPSQPLPATAAASTIPKELAGPARTEDGDRDVQGTAHHPCTKEA